MARTYNYYDFRDAKVNIAHALMAKGWEVFGYSADQSDAMTDYYCPAHWNGVASKNGYVLLVGVSSLSDSGRTVTKRTFNGTTKDVQNKIAKLQNMTTDKGASQQEEESAKAAIEKLLEKQNEGWTEEVVAVYPEFKNVNPSTSKWHIEKDGVLVDKGTGIGKFSDLPYNWDGVKNDYSNEDTQKAINSFNKFISRIEKIVNTITVTDGSEVGSADVNTMEKVTVQVTKTVTRPVQVEKKNVEVGDYLKFERRGGFWLVTNIYEVAGKVRISYENVGSEKRGYQQLKNCTRYYDLEERMMKSIQEGKTIIHQMKTFDEVTEVEKWVKVGKAPKVSKEAVTVDAKEVVTVSEETATGETVEASNNATNIIPATKKQLWALHCATKLNTTNLKIDKNKASELITKSKQGEDITSVIKILLNMDVEKITNKSETIKENVQEDSKPLQVDQSNYITKIDKQIESAQKKLESLSGDYLTNTWKRQNEEVSRENKRENLRFDISLLEYLKNKAVNNSMTTLDINLLNVQFREDLKNKYNAKKSRDYKVEYPIVDSRYDKDNWWNLEVPKRQKRLNKAGIFNSEQYNKAVDEYGLLIQELNKPVNPIQKQIKEMENKVKFYKIDGYFPTPKTIVQQMIDLADIQDGESILEPSAGNGNILDGVKQYSQDNGLNVNLDAIEFNYTLSQILELKQYKVVSNDFIEFTPFNKYNKIIMNPPFEKNQDIDHVMKAYDCLKDGGKLVAIMSPHWTFANDSKSVNFRNWLNDKGYYEKLPEGSFRESGTGVSTVLVVIDKLEDEYSMHG